MSAAAITDSTSASAGRRKVVRAASVAIDPRRRHRLVEADDRLPGLIERQLAAAPAAQPQRAALLARAVGDPQRPLALDRAAGRVGGAGPERLGDAGAGRHALVAAGEEAVHQLAASPRRRRCGRRGGRGRSRPAAARPGSRGSRSVGSWKLPTLSAREWRSAAEEALGANGSCTWTMSKGSELSSISSVPETSSGKRSGARLRPARHRDALADADDRGAGGAAVAADPLALPGGPEERAHVVAGPLDRLARLAHGAQALDRRRDDDAVAALAQLAGDTAGVVVHLVVRSPRVGRDVGDGEAGALGHEAQDRCRAAYDWPGRRPGVRPRTRRGERMSNYDYVIVGAGSAGCLLAARLTEDRDARVLLIEAGGKDRSPKIKIPAAFAQQFQTKLDWNYETEPEPGCNDRRLYIPRGRSLGGSSSMNAMLYVRGCAADYDGWAADGCEGWSWEEVLPYFHRSERREAAGPAEAAPRHRRHAQRRRPGQPEPDHRR